MSFKSIFKSYSTGLFFISAIFPVFSVMAAEWKIEPKLNMRAEYNDNTRMYPDTSDPDSSTGYTIDPAVKFMADEHQLWDMSFSARGKMTRYQDIEDADSNNVFLGFGGGRNTERSEWRLDTSFERNSNFDTDFDTETPSAGLQLDDHTERETISITPSVSWRTSKTSQFSFTLLANSVEYDEVTNINYRDYDYGRARFRAHWSLTESQQLGFTSSYNDYDSSDADFSYNNTELSLDYKYIINQVSDINLSVGGQRLESLRSNVTIGCEASGVIRPISDFSGTECPDLIGIFPVTPILIDVESENDGTIVDLTYNYISETVAQKISASRSIIPSSYGGVQEEKRLTYKIDAEHTERWSSRLILDATETETLDGINSLNDRTRYRIEPSAKYRLTRDWSLEFVYRYLEQNITITDTDATSNAVFVYLKLNWPKLVTTY